MCRVILFYLFSPNEQCGGWGGGMLPDFLFCSIFPVQQTTSGIGHRVKYLIVFFGLATNTLNVRNNDNHNNNNNVGETVVSRCFVGCLGQARKRCSNRPYYGSRNYASDVRPTDPLAAEVSSPQVRPYSLS